MYTKKYLNISIILFAVTQFSMAQSLTEPNKINSTINTDTIKKTYFQFCTSYLSDYVYNGRKDVITTPYIISTINYSNKNGLNAGLSSYYVNTVNDHKFDFLSLDANYDYEINNKCSAGIIANKTFYNQNNYGFNNNIKGLIGLNVDYDFNIIEMYVEADLLFFKKKDIGLNFDFFHEFEYNYKNNKFTIAPSFDVNFSTLNYFEDSNHVNRRKKAILVDTSTEVANKKFALLDYEFSLPLVYERHNFSVYITPTFIKPLNTVYSKDVKTVYSNGILKSTTATDSTTIEEIELKSTYFIELGIFYKLEM